MATGFPHPQRLCALSPEARNALLDRHQSVPEQVTIAVAEILEDVRRHGDEALRAATARFDHVDLETPWLGEATWTRRADEATEAVRTAIDGNLARIEAFHQLQVSEEVTHEVAPGILLGRRPIPHARVACYVPGGRAAYPSTVLMTVTLARLAGVEDILLVTPPGPDGAVPASVAYAAKAAGAHRILLAGGAQAIAAVAYGTQSIPAVDAIVGPGNAYVTAAKQAVARQRRIHIDAPAGPSEVLILADGTADPLPIALDMIAQAEHDPDAQSLLVTSDDGVAQAVAELLPTLTAAAHRSDIIVSSLQSHGAILVADDHEDAVAFADAYAAEHLEIHTADPRADLGRIRNAGSVFLGPSAPVSLGDYGSGTNHVLPTMGHARIRGGLSLDDFRKWITWQEVTPTGLAGVADDIMTLADDEGLHGHAAAVRRRLHPEASG